MCSLLGLQMGSGPTNQIHYTSFPSWSSRAHLNFRAQAVIYPLTPPGTVHAWYLSFAILDFSCCCCGVIPETNCCCLRGQILGGEDLWGSWASVNIFDLINTELWEMINAFLSCSHSFPDVSIITSYHFNTAIWHSSGNCPSVTVHLSPFLSMRI